VILAHGCFHLDQDLIGSVINRDVPQLRSQLRGIVDSLERRNDDSPA
jgi:hypothetical protein